MTDNPPPQRPSSADGASIGWSALGYLVAGCGFWGFMGWLVDGWLGVPMHLGLMVGMIVGMGAAIYLIVKRLGV